MSETKETGLKWLNLDAIHQHCHIDFNCEDAELEQMARLWGLTSSIATQ